MTLFGNHSGHPSLPKGNQGNPLESMQVILHFRKEIKEILRKSFPKGSQGNHLEIISSGKSRKPCGNHSGHPSLTKENQGFPLETKDIEFQNGISLPKEILDFKKFKIQ